MDDVLLYGRICALTLLGFELTLLVFRFFTCYNKKELISFSLILAYLGFKIIFPDVAYLTEISTYLVIWALGNYISIILEDNKKDLWNVAVFSAIGVFVVLILLGFKNHTLFAYFYLFTVCFLFFYPFISFIRYYSRTKNGTILFFTITSAGAMLGGGYEYVAAIYRLPFIGITMWIFLLIFLGVGYLLTQQGYLLSSEMHSLYSRLSLQERQLRQLSSKLVYTEQTLVVKDRFISLGLLSAGLIHEFKNILGLILSCTQYGSVHNDPERLRQSLSLIEEHTRHGLESVIGLLEKIKEKNTLTAEQLSMETFCFEILKVIRANYRGAGIDVVCQVHKDFDLSVRKAELEQAMLNIIRNAAQALNAFPQKKDKTIKIEISSDFDKGMLSLSDNAGGIPSEIACNIFEPHFRSGKSTGMGLYLTKMMAEQLGVQLIYEPIKDGSRFTFIFPLS